MPRGRLVRLPSGSGLATGIALGIAIGVAADNIGGWLAIGIAIGAATEGGQAASRRNDPSREAE